MESRKCIAAENKRCGKYNCAQAVLCAYSDLTGLDEETSKNLAYAFAAGMGNMEGTCGAIVGAGMTLSMITKDRAKAMKGMRVVMEKFRERNGSTICKDLKGIETKTVLRECPDCVADACEFLEELL
ncbi:MAG: C-GCAxxG-C-C family protein [Bacteroidaceae bacterium]|nr:C-GCAxxG-C-C family protein [Bacteroidaceae bacterium]